MAVIDLDRFRQTALEREPFDYLVVPDFIRPEARLALRHAFPALAEPGAHPVRGLHYGAAFASLLRELRGAGVRAAFEEKFGIELKRLPTVVTVRGLCGPRDGRIHTDLPGKVITVLLYLNSTWKSAGGRLRLLRSPDDIEDIVIEVPPIEGTLVAFRRSENSFHGHKPFLGVRRVVQLNWVTRRHLWALRQEEVKQRLTSFVRYCLSGGEGGGQRRAA
jgi:hypothetical protein